MFALTDNLDTTRPIPCDLDAEMAVLGCMMFTSNTIDDVSGTLNAEMFCLPQHDMLYRVLSEMHAKGEPMDLLIVSADLRKAKKLEAVGGQEYMIQLAESFGSLGMAEHYAQIVSEKYRLRELIRLTERVAEAAYSPIADAERVLADAGEQLDKISGKRNSELVDDSCDLVASLADDARSSGNRTFVTSGLSGVDDAIGGLERGGLTIIAARPSVGKTSLGLSFALAAAASDVPSLFVSVEMPSKAIAQRIAAATGTHTMHEIRFTLSADELDSMAETVIGNIGHDHLFVASRISDSRDITSVVRVMARKHNIELVVIDYLQLCRGPRAETRNLQIADMTGGFKHLAMECNLAVVLLSQLNRGSTRDGRTPGLSDLRDSGAIEQDADVVAILIRDADGDKASANRADHYELTLKIAKNRNGDLRRMQLTFHPRTMTFSMGVEPWTQTVPF